MRGTHVRNRGVEVNRGEARGYLLLHPIFFSLVLLERIRLLFRIIDSCENEVLPFLVSRYGGAKERARPRTCYGLFRKQLVVLIKTALIRHCTLIG